MNTGRRWKLIMNKVSHHQRRPSRRPCSASTRRSWDSAAEWPEPWRKPHIPLGGCEARRAGRRRHPRLHPEDSHTQETKSSIRPCFIRWSKDWGKKRKKKSPTTFQRPSFPHLSPAATNKLLLQGWKAKEKTRSFTTLATRSSVNFISFRPELYLQTPAQSHIWSQSWFGLIKNKTTKTETYCFNSNFPVRVSADSWLK